MSKIILVTSAPAERGLAYFYRLALDDLLPAGSVELLDDTRHGHGVARWRRGLNRIKYATGRWASHLRREIKRRAAESGGAAVILFNTAGLRESDLDELAQDANVRLLQYLSDTPFGMPPKQCELVLGNLDRFDAIMTFSRPLVPVLYQYGARHVTRIPFAYCKRMHYIPLDPAHEVGVEGRRVLYCGTWSSLIEKWIAPLADFDLMIEGNYWERAQSARLREVALPSDHSQMARLAHDAAVVVNFVRAEHGCAHSMKTFELPAAGACVVTNRTEEQLEFFREGEEMAFFDTPDEMCSAVETLLDDPDRMFGMRRAAQTTCLGHSYHERSRQMIDGLRELELLD
jgi:hypothetical protein